MPPRPRGFAAAAALLVLAAGCGRAGDTPSPAAPGTTGPAVPSSATGTPSPTARPAADFAYLPLYPFADTAQVRDGGTDAPWEVAGTRDTTLTLDTPRYGTAATSPLAVGGSVSGVDENLRVRVLGADGPVGEFCCLPAGGERTRWATAVTLAVAARGTLTVVVSTGGHVGEVERFAVTGVSAPR